MHHCPRAAAARALRERAVHQVLFLSRSPPILISRAGKAADGFAIHAHAMTKEERHTHGNRCKARARHLEPGGRDCCTYRLIRPAQTIVSVTVQAFSLPRKKERGERRCEKEGKDAAKVLRESSTYCCNHYHTMLPIYARKGCPISATVKEQQAPPWYSLHEYDYNYLPNFTFFSFSSIFPHLLVPGSHRVRAIQVHLHACGTLNATYLLDEPSCEFRLHGSLSIPIRLLVVR